MTVAQPYSFQRQNPLLYWTTILYLVGTPNFVHFDETGRTHAQGLLNPTSISALIITFISTYILLTVVVLARRPLLCRKVSISGWLWIALLLQLIVSTVLQPVSIRTPPAASDLLVSFYRMYEWILAFLLILALYSRAPAERATELIVQLIGRTSWIWIAMTWLILPIMPSQVYGGAGEGEVAAHAQLGGELISPSYLATLAIGAFFYSLFFFPKGLVRAIGCVVAFATLVLARTRIEQLSFLLLILLYAIFFSGKFVLRLATIITTFIVAALGILFKDSIVAYISRGQSANSLATLNDRTIVWQATIQAVRARPLLGYGYVVGAKNAIRDYWTHSNWIPPHAHNEYLHAILSGGVLALLLVLCIYGRSLWVGFRTAYRGHNQVFLLLMMILFTVRSIGGSNFTYIYTRTGAIFVLTFIGIVGGAETLKHRSSAKAIRSSDQFVPQEVGT